MFCLDLDKKSVLAVSVMALLVSGGVPFAVHAQEQALNATPQAASESVDQASADMQAAPAETTALAPAETSLQPAAASAPSPAPTPAATEKTELPVGDDSKQNAAVAGEIANINQRIALLAAQYSELEMQAKIALKMSEIKKLNSGESADAPKTGDENSPSAFQTSSQSPQMTDDYAAPSVKEIFGVDGKMKASLYLKNGTIQTVKVRDTVGGWTVRDISVDAVVVEKKGRIVRLPFGNYVAASGVSTSSVRTSPPAAPMGGIPPVGLVN